MRTRLAFLVLVLAAAGLFAQTRRTRLTFLIGSGSNEMTARRLFGSQWAALASLGYTCGTAFSATTTDATTPDTWAVGLSARHYFAPSELRPFAEAGGGMPWIDIAGHAHVRTPFETAADGVEYSVAPHVSIEGNRRAELFFVFAAVRNSTGSRRATTSTRYPRSAAH